MIILGVELIGNGLSKSKAKLSVFYFISKPI